MVIRPMKKILIAFLLISSAVAANAQSETEQRIVPNRKNDPSQEDKPYVILISADGFRWDYAQKYHAQHLLDLSGEGVSAEAMLPSFPSVTFPNHYSIVTGLYPSHEGLVGNSFYDAGSKQFFSYKGKTATDAIWYNGGHPLWG